MTEITTRIVGIDSVITKLQAMPDAIRQSLKRTITEQALIVESIVKDDKLSGGVLKNRTGQLRASVHTQVDDDETSVIASVGANTPYAAFQEYGYVGTEQVKEHLRTMNMAFGKMITPKEVMVRAHARNVHYPAHSYLRSTLAEQADSIRDAMSQAVSEAIA